MSIDKLDNTSVVVCSYHRTLDPTVNYDGHHIVRSFHEEKFPNFHVLFDDHHGYSEEYVSEKYGGPNICIYNDEDFAKYGFDKPISSYHFWGSHQNPKYFFAHFRMLTFFLKNPNYEYYWFFDDDVKFEGSVKSLLENYSDVDDDFIVVQAFKKEDYPEHPNVSVINSRMEGSRGHWLGHCPGPGDNFKSTEKHIGSFYPVVRYSKRSMEHLMKLHEEGYYGYSEGFVPTSLASDGFKVSSMMDEHNNFFIKNEVCTLLHKGQKFTWEWL